MKINAPHPRVRFSHWALTLLISFTCCAAEEDFYSDPPIYQSRPDPNREMPFGHIGVTGVMVRIYRGVTIKVEKTVPGSPADGKFKKGEIITGINGVSLKGKNPFVTLGNCAHRRRGHRRPDDLRRHLRRWYIEEKGNRSHPRAGFLQQDLAA